MLSLLFLILSQSLFANNKDFKENVTARKIEYKKYCGTVERYNKNLDVTFQQYLGVRYGCEDETPVKLRDMIHDNADLSYDEQRKFELQIAEYDPRDPHLKNILSRMAFGKKNPEITKVLKMLLNEEVLPALLSKQKEQKEMAQASLIKINWLTFFLQTKDYSFFREKANFIAVFYSQRKIDDILKNGFTFQEKKSAFEKYKKLSKNPEVISNVNAGTMTLSKKNQ